MATLAPLLLLYPYYSGTGVYLSHHKVSSNLFSRGFLIFLLDIGEGRKNFLKIFLVCESGKSPQVWG